MGRKRKFSKEHLDKLSKDRTKANQKVLNCKYCQRTISALNLAKHEKACIENPHWEGSQYRDICFFHHAAKCVCCREKNVVEVHHFDRNRENNLPENLIPLCPTHHAYIHNEKFKHLVEHKVLKYVEQFIKSRS